MVVETNGGKKKGGKEVVDYTALESNIAAAKTYAQRVSGSKYTHTMRRV